MRYVGVRAVPHGWLRDRVQFLYVMDDIRHYFNLFYILFDLSPFRCVVDCSLFVFKCCYSILYSYAYLYWNVYPCLVRKRLFGENVTWIKNVCIILLVQLLFEFLSGYFLFANFLINPF